MSFTNATCRLTEPSMPVPTAGSILPLPGPDAAEPALPEQFGLAFLAADAEARRQALTLLLPHVGTMALLVIGQGRFARFAARSPLAPTLVSSHDVAQVDHRTVVDLVRYLEQRSPQVPRRVLALLEAGLPAPAPAVVTARSPLRPQGHARRS